MTVTPAEIRLAFDDFLNEVDRLGRDVDWTLADAKAAFEEWLAPAGRDPVALEWNDLYDKSVRDALSDRYRFIIVEGGRWASP